MKPWERVDDFLRRAGIRFGAPTLGQTTGGRHDPDSHHYAGNARDYGQSNSDMSAIVDALLPFAQGPNALVVELYSSTKGVFYKNGRAITPSADVRKGHYSHVHVAVRSDATFGAAPSSTSGTTPGVAVEPAGIGSGVTGAIGRSVGRIVLEGVFAAAGVALVVLGALRAAKEGGAPWGLASTTT